MASSSDERSELESGGYSVDGSEDCSVSSDEEAEESDWEKSTGKFSLVPRPRLPKLRRGPGTHCVRMRLLFMGI